MIEKKVYWMRSSGGLLERLTRDTKGLSIFFLLFCSHIFFPDKRARAMIMTIHAPPSPPSPGNHIHPHTSAPLFPPISLYRHLKLVCFISSRSTVPWSNIQIVLDTPSPATPTANRTSWAHISKLIDPEHPSEAHDPTVPQTIVSSPCHSWALSVTCP